jgi:hypothetical protein
MAAPYRTPAEREVLPEPPHPRRWFIRHGDSEDGPFEAHVLARSLKAGLLWWGSQVRAEDGVEWRPLGAVRALQPRCGGPAPVPEWLRRTLPRPRARTLDDGELGLVSAASRQRGFAFPSIAEVLLFLVAFVLLALIFRK